MQTRLANSVTKPEDCNSVFFFMSNPPYIRFAPAM